MSEMDAAPQEVEQPAATPENVAAPVAETPAEQEVKTEAEEKTFTQEQLNEIIQKEKAKAEAKAERRALKAYRETLERVIPQPQQQPQQPVSDRPTQANYANVDDYVEAMANWKLEQHMKGAREYQQRQQAATVASKTETIYQEAQKLPGFDREAFDELPLTPAIAAALVSGDSPAKVMAYMAANPAEVERIARLPPARQAAEIGKLEDKVSSIPKASNAPAPLKPVGTRGSVANTDRSRMSMEEYAAARRKEGASWVRR